MDLKEENTLGDDIHTHWYYRSKVCAAKKILRTHPFKKILDIGAGSGFFSKYFLTENLAKSAVCVDTAYENETDFENFSSGKIRFVKSYQAADEDLLLMMDVLEHVPDDVSLLKKYTQDMSSDAKLLITVPAFQFLWSDHDVFLEHYRRYTIKSLSKSVQEAGLEIEKISYFYASLFPVVACLRLIKNLFRNPADEPKSDLKPYPKWLNAILLTIHRAEAALVFPHNKLFGLSVFCLCRKK